MISYRDVQFVVGIIVVAGICVPWGASAYVDPGSGSYFLQIVLGVVLASLASIKIYWHRIKGFFGARKRKQNMHDSTSH